MKRLLLTFAALLSLTVVMAQQTYHIIQSGETLESIAKDYKVSVEDLKMANPEAVSKLYEGMQIIIPSSNSRKIKAERVEKSENDYQSVQEFSHDYSPTNQDVSNSTSRIVNENNAQESRKNTWHFAFRLGPSFFKGEKSGGITKAKGGTYTSSSSTGYEVALGTHYYFLENLYGSAMLGYYQTSSYFVIAQIGSYNSSTSVSKNIQLPIEVGLFLPFSKYLGLIFEAGPTLLYAVDGYIETNGEKKSFSDIEKDAKIDRFSAVLKLGGGLRFGGFSVQGFYGIPLTKVQGGEKKGFWGITLGAEL